MEATHVHTDLIALAARFVNNTSRHIFLTGKAGTGKTTFLHNLARATHKRFLIVAPTGIAALNAGGVTIHSQFLLPPGTFIPAEFQDQAAPGPFYTRADLMRRQPLNNVRRQVLRHIDLLIIDEVSMLRADVLDAIDMRLRHARNTRSRSFGGVQLLMIGDLHQLPPIVRDHEWERMQQYYRSPHFFEALALRQDGYCHIELDKIFRQSDPTFINLLNHLRNNTCTQEHIAALNAYYQPNTPVPPDVITLTTHNAQAEQINSARLASLPAAERKFRAAVRGDFPEPLYPLPETLVLKEGARVMFVKNDTQEGRYFNGKLATVKHMGEESIFVQDDEGKAITVEIAIWENKRYTLSENSKELTEEVAGTFMQFPLKLAWAITVHKSQGLTFAKAAIDVGRAFAPGQVYVALSRLQSLEGLILRTPIHSGAISCDAAVRNFNSARPDPEALAVTLNQAQKDYLRDALCQTFDFTDVRDLVLRFKSKTEGSAEFADPEMRTALAKLGDMLLSENENTGKFQSQIRSLLHTGDFAALHSRIEKGSAYYVDFLTRCMKHMLIHIAEVSTLSKVKTYLTACDEIDQLLQHKLDHLLKASHLTLCMAEGREVDRNPDVDLRRAEIRKSLLAQVEAHMKLNPKNLSTKTGRVKKKKDSNAPSGIIKAAREKGETYRITLEMLQKGMDIEQVAKTRELSKGTIETHAARLIEEGKLAYEPYISESELEAIRAVWIEKPEATGGEVFNRFSGKYSYAKIRIAKAVISLNDPPEEDSEAASG